LEPCAPNPEPRGSDEEIIAIAEALQGLRLTVLLDDRPLAHLAEAVQVAVRDATWAAVPRLRDQVPPAVTTEAIDGDRLMVAASVPLAATAEIEQAYIVLIDEGAALVMPTGGTAFSTSGQQLTVIELEREPGVGV
jgi:hypothetical protein